jgi:regulator of replication initiation timing
MKQPNITTLQQRIEVLTKDLVQAKEQLKHERIVNDFLKRELDDLREEIKNASDAVEYIKGIWIIKAYLWLVSKHRDQRK